MQSSMKKVLMAAVLLLCPVLLGTASAQEVEEGGIRYRLDDGFATIIGVDPSLTVLRVPATFQGRPTCAEKSDELVIAADTLILEEGIVWMDPYAGILAAHQFKQIELPGTFVVSQGERFYLLDWLFGQPYLETLCLPQSVTKRDITELFYDMASLKQQTQYTQYEFFLHWVEEGMTEQEMAKAFLSEARAHQTLERIKIDPRNTELYDIDGVVFQRGTDTLLACPPNRKGVYTVPEGTRAIGDRAFYWCDMLERINLPQSVTKIGVSAFSACARVRTIQLPPTLDQIDKWAFSNCISLESITIPSGTAVGEGAFNYCESLRSVYFAGQCGKVDETAFQCCHRELVVYAPADTEASYAAAAAGVLWTGLDGGSPQKLPNPYAVHHQIAFIHAEDPDALVEVYEEPTDESEAVCLLSVGTVAEMLSEKDGWVNIKSYEGSGYVPAANLKPAVEDVLRIVQAYRNSKQSVILYEAPSYAAREIENENENIFSVLQHFGEWFLVRRENGETCYVSMENVAGAGMNYDGNVYMVANGEQGRYVELYCEPSADSEVLDVYYNGTQIIMHEVYMYDENAEDDEIFCLVEIGGRKGYMLWSNMTEVWEEWNIYLV